MSKKTAPARISQHLTIERRYARSVFVERDLEDAGALSGYVVTPAVREALGRLAAGLRLDSSQRAWCLTGAYGSGKSSLGLFISHLLGQGPLSSQAGKLLGSSSEELGKAWKQAPRLLPVVVTGSREALGQKLAEAMLRTMGLIVGKGRPPALIADLQVFAKQHAAGKVSESHVVELLKRFVQFVATKRSGVLLMIDEMGKLLEFAALHPERSDIYTFQQIAELASGTSGTPLAVVGILHQRFADYAEQLGRSVESDWGKVAGRFEEIIFDESLEQFAFLLSAAINIPERVLADAGVTACAQTLYGRSMARHELPVGSREAALAAMGESLYPIHPTTLAVLCTSMKRFAQGERSVFSFVASNEPFGLNAFASKNDLTPATWYRLPQLYDYFAHGATLRLRTADQRRRWEALQETLASGTELSEAEVDVLKAAGLISILGPMPGLMGTADAIAFANADRESDPEVAKAAAALIEKRLLFKRSNGELVLWQRSSVDLVAQYEEASRQVRDAGGIAALSGLLPPPRPVVAHRHYHRTGTLRAFRVAYATLDAVEKMGPFADGQHFDGEIVVVLVPPTENAVEAAKAIARFEAAKDARHLMCVRQLDREDIASFEEVRRWEWVLKNCDELRVDAFANSEVAQRVEKLSAAIGARLDRMVRSPGGAGGKSVWLHKQEKIDVRSDRELSQKLSDVCDEVFHGAPIVRNELINRHQLSSAVALARFRLVERMLTDGAKPRLAIEGYPPEYAIFASLLERSGMHEPTVAPYFHAPSKPDRGHWGPAWKALERLLLPGGGVSFETILDELAKPPIGVRNGPAMVLMIAFMLARPREIGMFERGTFITEFTVDHFQRSMKSLKNFAVHYFPVQDIALASLRTYGDILAKLGASVEAAGDFNGVAKALYRWFRNLPSFTMVTAEISQDATAIRVAIKKAQDPLELLFTALPKSLGFAPMKELDIEGLLGYGTRVSLALQDLDQAEARLRGRMAEALLSAFHPRAASISVLRERLRLHGEAFSKELADYRLKSFIERAADASLSEDKWLESMGSLLTAKSVASWSDHEFDVFRAEAKARAGQLERWMTLLFSRTESNDALKNLLGLFVTDRSGKEEHMLVEREGAKQAYRDEIRKRALELSDNDFQKAAHLLAQVLSAMLEQAPQDDKKKENRNGRKTR